MAVFLFERLKHIGEVVTETSVKVDVRASDYIAWCTVLVVADFVPPSLSTSRAAEAFEKERQYEREHAEKVAKQTSSEHATAQGSTGDDTKNIYPWQKVVGKRKSSMKRYTVFVCAILVFSIILLNN